MGQDVIKVLHKCEHQRLDLLLSIDEVIKAVSPVMAKLPAEDPLVQSLQTAVTKCIELVEAQDKDLD